MCDTPLYEWPDLPDKTSEGETFDTINKFHVYPRSKTTKHTKENEPRVKAAQNLNEIQKRVEAVLKGMDVDIGNVVPFIINNLAVPAAERERELLPKIDYSNPVFWYDITEECKSMMYKKIKFAQIQHAHDLHLNGMVDIAITWHCGSDPDVAERKIMATQEEVAVMKHAWDMHYKCLDGDRMHMKPRPKGDPKKREVNEFDDLDPHWRRFEEMLPIPQMLGGFFAVVNLDQLSALIELQKSWKINITTIIEPQLMSVAEAQKMEEYQDSRRILEEQAMVKKEAELEAAREATKSVQKEDDEQKAITYSKTLEISVDRLEHQL